MKPLLFISMLFIISGCDQKMQQVAPEKSVKPDILKTQLNTLNKAKQVSDNANDATVQQQETINNLTDSASSKH